MVIKSNFNHFNDQNFNRVINTDLCSSKKKQQNNDKESETNEKPVFLDIYLVDQRSLFSFLVHQAFLQHQTMNM